MGFLCAEYDYEMDMQVKGEEKYEEGYVAGKSESIIELLGTVGIVSEELKCIIMNQKDMDILKEWLILSNKVSNIEEFRKEAKI